MEYLYQQNGLALCLDSAAVDTDIDEGFDESTVALLQPEPIHEESVPVELPSPSIDSEVEVEAPISAMPCHLLVLPESVCCIALLCNCIIVCNVVLCQCSQTL